MENLVKRARPVMANASVSMLLASSMVLPIVAGCGNNGTGNAGSNAQPPVARQGYGNQGGYNAPRSTPQQQQPRQGMSTGQKLAVLAGGAALLYMYNKNKNNQGTGVNGKYYRSKNGRIYYRDAKGNAVYVTPPQGGIQVPADVAERYNRAAQSGNYGLIDGDNFGSGGGMNGSGYGGAYDDPRGQGGDVRGQGGYGGSGYGAPYGSDRVPSGAGAGSAMPPGPRGGF